MPGSEAAAKLMVEEWRMALDLLTRVDDHVGFEEGEVDPARVFGIRAGKAVLTGTIGVLFGGLYYVVEGFLAAEERGYGEWGVQN